MQEPFSTMIIKVVLIALTLFGLGLGALYVFWRALSVDQTSGAKPAAVVSRLVLLSGTMVILCVVLLYVGSKL